ncbi:3153_t:CDS:2 [Paraglomus occultum]|uniref:3153_t:CDS:1 n=1 Tax=Paraglomus occultum TaxID=144539 RepID=A0A9N8ZUZ6_9GLOM|nr:3153_t:CDS:2 [Paraglomus occultum]
MLGSIIQTFARKQTHIPITFVRSVRLLTLRSINNNSNLAINKKASSVAQINVKALSSTIPPKNVPSAWQSTSSLSRLLLRRKFYLSSKPSFFFSNKYNVSAISLKPPPSSASRALTVPTKPIVGYWLLSTAALVFGIVILGGLTRLTESGLSIVEWKPVTGVMLPVSETQWQEEFEKYKQFPEYKLLNYEMDLSDFKYIYLMEWAHRIWGRAIGVAFLIPAVYFGARGYMSRTVMKKVVGLAGLLGFQGVLGWYMVKSGLSEHLLSTPGAVPRVSHYRLAAHLGSAFLLYGGMLLTGLQVLRDAKITKGAYDLSVSKTLLDSNLNAFRRFAIATAILVFITSMSGALVAGLDAGLIYNEFPYMGKNITPPRDELLSPEYIRKGDSLPWRNFFDNPTTVQFDHRVLAMTTTGVIFALWLYSRKLNLPIQARRAVNVLLGVVGLQATLGISTLIYMVPIELASAHQAGSLTLLTSALWLVHALKRIPVR